MRPACVSWPGSQLPGSRLIILVDLRGIKVIEEECGGCLAAAVFRAAPGTLGSWREVSYS